jgi:hypothetical protein
MDEILSSLGLPLISMPGPDDTGVRAHFFEVLLDRFEGLRFSIDVLLEEEGKDVVVKTTQMIMSKLYYHIPGFDAKMIFHHFVPDKDQEDSRITVEPVVNMVTMKMSCKPLG